MKTPDPFSIVHIDSSQSEDLEQLGTKPKFWFTFNEKRTLFKAENRGTGEDWAEVIAAEICTILGLPHVPYRLAHDTHNNLPGVICPNIATKPYTLVLGNQLMVEFDPKYSISEERTYGVREHTVSSVAEVVKTLDPIPQTDQTCQLAEEYCSSVHVFVGYIMLDTLIANQDRHHQNWGALRVAGKSWLAPTFDHGAGLARNEPDSKRQRRLAGSDRERAIMAFAKRARTGFYNSPDDKRTLKSHACFAAWYAREPVAGNFWLARLARIKEVDFQSIVERVPESRMTPITREFTLELLKVNQRLLLEHREGRA